MIKHVNFQLYKTYPAKTIWKNRQTIDYKIYMQTSSCNILKDTVYTKELITVAFYEKYGN